MRTLRFCFQILFLLVFSTGLSHCKKAKEKLQEQYVVDVITDGRWIVQTFTEDSIDITTSFKDYEFQFTDNGKVIGIKISTSEQIPGTWVGNIADLTIASAFPGAGEPLSKLNDTWKVINSSSKLVEAKPFNSNRIAYLKLVKKG